MNTKIRLALPEDIPAMEELWDRVFNDDKRYVQSFFDSVFPLCKGVVFDDESVKGMLFLVPYTIIQQNESLPIHYVYAVAVDEDARNKGVMRSMLDFAYQYSIQNGFIGHILIPATPSLFQLYEKNGFRDFSTKSFYDFSQLDSLQRTLISLEQYIEKRKDFLTENGAVLAMNDVINQTLFEVKKSDFKTFSFENEDNTIGIGIVKDQKIIELLGAPFEPKEVKKYTMIKTAKDQKFDSPYFNFGMD